MSSQISSFMSDFLLAASDYQRLDETVHDFLDNGSPARIDEFSNRISEALVNAKSSITAAVASGSNVTLVDELPEDIRGDVRFALKMSIHWMERVRLLESMLRALVMETDTDYIELMVRARQNLARMGIQEVFSDDEPDYGYEDEPEDDEPIIAEPETGSDEGPSEVFPVNGPDLVHIEDEPIIEEPKTGTDEDPSEVFPINGPDLVHIEDEPIIEESEEEVIEPIIEEPVERLPPCDDGDSIQPVEEQTIPAEEQGTSTDDKPLTKDDVAEIVLDVITDLFKPEQSSQPQRIEFDEIEEEELKPARKRASTRKTTTKKKTATKKNPIRKVREILKKDEETEVSE